MSPNTSPLRPPCIANWLIGLFTSGWHEDSILGDLLEEFSELASKSGLTCARRWYWRQSIKTIGQLMANGLRTAPWLITGTVIGGYLLRGFGFSLPEKLIDTFLEFRRHGVIPYYTQREMDAYLFWLNNGILIGHLLVSLVTGCVVALTAKAREISATVMLGALLFAFSVMTSVNAAIHSTQPRLPLPIILANLAGIILIPIGGVIVRQVRRAAGALPSIRNLVPRQ